MTEGHVTKSNNQVWKWQETAFYEGQPWTQGLKVNWQDCVLTPPPPPAQVHWSVSAQGNHGLLSLMAVVCFFSRVHWGSVRTATPWSAAWPSTAAAALHPKRAEFRFCPGPKEVQFIPTRAWKSPTSETDAGKLQTVSTGFNVEKKYEENYILIFIKDVF